MFKVMNALVPQYICNRFKEREVKYNMRSNNVLFMEKPNTEYMKRSFTYRGAKLWNSLDDGVRNVTDLANFKRNLCNVTTMF